MINKDELEIGMDVGYLNPPSTPQIGRVTSWNDLWVFVDYGTGNSQATSYNHLFRVKQVDKSESMLETNFQDFVQMIRNAKSELELVELYNKAGELFSGDYWQKLNLEVETKYREFLKEG